mgnify:CR=1 FL=1
MLRPSILLVVISSVMLNLSSHCRYRFGEWRKRERYVEIELREYVSNFND